ncbi:MAG: glutathione S-transferase family protein [Hydrogenophaga sp.]|uniref:glutathione S-transferase family protein n=1 Tax=Hydrogenophaga sp. TaxID=1904254 RepID=UPI001DD0A2D8|nr:glutathione S-transferase family protein [Hydrogenophaga sp.]MBX3611409.1 glutathione S-transferase family protein [Hydrogenophaga sp.]
MHDLILHHYPMSPFAEKARSMLGFKGLVWHSVHIPSVMPKPDVVALTGGYRRTPLLQIGADIYCDTALIADVLEHREPEPALFPVHARGLARLVAQWADTTLFWASMSHTLSPKGAAALFGKAPPEEGKTFATDRAAMRVNMTQLRPADATSAYRSYLRRLANMLDDQPYLLGEQPCVADFAAFHPLWFTLRINPAMAGIFDGTPDVLEWFERIEAIGHGQPQRMRSADAVGIAHAATPEPIKPDEVFQDDHGIALGSRVTIAAESFGTETTEGTLRAATRTRYTVERQDERAGTVHVHFPRVGYVLREVKA